MQALMSVAFSCLLHAFGGKHRLRVCEWLCDCLLWFLLLLDVHQLVYA